MEAGLSTPPMSERAYVELARQLALSDHGPIVLPEDLRQIDRLTGSRRRTYELVDQLERAGRLVQLRRGTYVLVSSTGVVEADLLDLIAILTPEPYLVTAGRALEVHELSDQHFRRVVVLVRGARRSWSFRGDTVRYVVPRGGAPWSAPRARTKRGRTVSIASPERAIVDSLAHPSYGVTLAQVVEAVDLALRHNQEFALRLADAARQFGSAAVSRRLGFIVSRVADEQMGHVFWPLRGTRKGATPLQAGGPQRGPIDPTWQVRENVPFELLLGHREIG